MVNSTPEALSLLSTSCMSGEAAALIVLLESEIDPQEQRKPAARHTEYAAEDPSPAPAGKLEMTVAESPGRSLNRIMNLYRNYPNAP